MRKKRQKYYVVWKGEQTGVFQNWNDCQESIHKFKGARFKSFDSIELANKAFSEPYENYVAERPLKRRNPKSPIRTNEHLIDSVSVDAACSGNPGILEYQGIDNVSQDQLFYFGPLHDSTNNIGEFLAIVHALALMKLNDDHRPIYSDSRTALSWIKAKKCRTKLKRTSENKKSFVLIDRAIKWLEENDYQNELLKWNTRAWGEIPADFGRK